MKRLIINPDGTGTYQVADGKIVDAGAAYKRIMETPELLAQAVKFALGHVLRNATAGKMENVDEAHKAASERAATIAVQGKWAAHKESGETGESRTSLLATALARVMGTEPKDAAEFISEEIRTAMEEAGHDPDADSDDLTPEQKQARRKLANKVRKTIQDDPAVALALRDVKDERAKAEREELAKKAATEKSRFA